MKHIVRLLTTFNLLLIALAIKANDKGQVYRAVYELNEIYTYIGNNREPDISDERSEAKLGRIYYALNCILNHHSATVTTRG